jgi:hypothetical protein
MEDAIVENEDVESPSINNVTHEMQLSEKKKVMKYRK